MASTSNRRLEELRATARANEIKTLKLLAQSRQTRNTSKADINRNHFQNEKKVVNSFTELVESKRENECKNTLVHNILVRKIRNHLIDSGRCDNDKAVELAAKKMAAFVSDVMKETYKTQKVPKRLSVGKADNRDKSFANPMRTSVTKLRSRDLLPKVVEETRSNRVVKTCEPKKEKMRASDTGFVHKQSHQPVSHAQATKAQSKGNRGDITSNSTEKEKLNNWLNDVSDRTKKWSEWIKDTVEKAETTKDRVRSGEDLREVSKDWKKFMNVKQEQSKQLNDSFTDLRKRGDEACRRRGQDTIEQWLLKNKLNIHKNDRSNYSVRTASSSESLYSVWSSRGPSSIFGGDSDYRRLKRLGMVP